MNKILRNIGIGTFVLTLLYIFLSFVGGAGLFFGVLLTIINPECNPSKTYWYDTVVIKKDTVYINCIGYGVTGDHRIVKISDRKSSKFQESKSEYYLDYYCNVLYKASDDTLYIATEKEFIMPTENKLEINIKFIHIENVNHKDRLLKTGYTQISPYKNH